MTNNNNNNNLKDFQHLTGTERLDIARQLHLIEKQKEAYDRKGPMRDSTAGFITIVAYVIIGGLVYLFTHGCC